MKPKTYNCNLAAKVILDLARLDGVGGILRDHLVQVWFSSETNQRLTAVQRGSLTFDTHLGGWSLWT